MTGIIHFETFLVAGILLNLTPGNDTIFILTKSIAQGKKAGIMSVLGIATGSLIHTTLAALGLSIIIAQSITVFTIIKYAGAAYLLWVGYKMIISRSNVDRSPVDPGSRTSLMKTYRDGVLTNVLNPKVAMFFIAFLPQFIDPAYQKSFIPFMLLGITFTITGTIWCLVLASFSSLLFSKLRSNQNFSVFLNRVCGTALIALGIKLVLTDRSLTKN